MKNLAGNTLTFNIKANQTVLCLKQMIQDPLHDALSYSVGVAVVIRNGDATSVIGCSALTGVFGRVPCVLSL